MHRKIALTALVLSALGIVSCGRPRPVHRGPSGETYVYVLSTGDMPVSAGGLGVGFNLDGLVSDGATDACNDAPDVSSFITGARGVDNSWASVVPTGDTVEGRFQAALEAQIAAGTFLLLIEVTDVDSLGLPDLDPNADDDTVCNSISIGFSFEAVSANP